MRAFREKFGDVSADEISARLRALAQEFLAHDVREKEARSVKAGG
jgi:hypothetical protein